MSIPPPREGSRATHEGIIISKYPDVCRSPTAPVPYTIIAYQDDDANTASSVFMTGQRAHKQNSIVTKCTGDEPGKGLGVCSNTVSSICHRKRHSNNVRIEGQWATRDSDEWWMNNKNTVGKLVWPKHQKSFGPTPPLLVSDDMYAEDSDEGKIMSDALPDPLVMNAQYAQNAAVAPTPVQQNSNPVNPGQVPSGGSPFNQNGFNGKGEIPPSANDNKPEELSRWWKIVNMLKNIKTISPSGPGAMEAMSYADYWLKRNVNQPQDWYKKGLWVGDPTQKEHYVDNDVPNGSGIEATAQRTDKKPEPHSRTEGNTSILGKPKKDEEEKKDCGCHVGSYDKMKKSCNTLCGPGYQAHHIVPDYTLRYGTRAEAERDEKRIPGLPKFGEGPSICLFGQKADAGSEHGLAHAADMQVYTAGSGSSTPQGTTDIGTITAISMSAAISAKGGKCVAEITLELQKHPNLFSDILGRTTIPPPIEGVDKAYELLKNGVRATKH
ncbi:DUF4150 domain-containing protein [Agrobacterium vaccinii]|uniref:DUF4150 domain-containing protein n=1 Tax=Agrobacterium vaccinii TaxID=2735528 RepID=UPI001E4165E0|nr:DUF4150 domain-containing protein [Agrobacterium vaccinii]UHS61726.1 DUF4150 domain-containing protein [Agrobacterium vaccinii]